MTYSNESKIAVLGIEKAIIVRDGAVSHAVAKAMAKAVRDRFGSDIGISITGIAGPDGGSEAKPGGTFFVGYSAGDLTDSYHFFYPSSRNQFRRYAAYKALDVVRRHLLGRSIPTHVSDQGGAA